MSITTLPAKLLGPAIFIAFELPLHEVQSIIKSSANEAASVKFPTDAFSDNPSPSLLCLPTHSQTSFFVIS